ncbi:ABC transporter substrate-binding protein [Streptomyces sp. NPDC007984]|uniref:ABC transporter substrate-binding protein n=1 Tax=Streptomyces sp. NPDC007984 TaxID=3364801 RepID=UPI0036EB0F92
MRIRAPHTPLRALAPVALATTSVLLTTTACDGQAASSSATSVLSLAIMGTPNSFAPAQLTEGQQAYVWSSLYDTLLLVGNDGKLQPGAAQSWTYSDGGRTLTLKLRTGMKFSSGSPVTAAAVKTTLDLVRTSGQNQTQLGAVQSIGAPDDRTVVLRLRNADASLLHALTGAGGVVADPRTMKTRSSALNPVSSGPYTLDKDATVNGSVYVLKRRDDYWNRRAYPFPTVKIKVISDRAASVNALKAGEINAVSVEVQQLSSLESAGFTTKHIEAGSVATLLLSDRRGEVLKPLGDVRVRKAINMAFDRKKMVRLFLKGSGKQTEQLYHPLGEGYDPPLDTTYPYDPAGAKKLLAEAGYPDGFSVNMPSLYFTKPFEPTFAQSLADIGVKVTWDPVPAQQTISALATRKYPMALVVDGLDPIPVQTRDYFSPNGYRNVFASTDPRLTRLLLRANSAPDAAKAADVYKEIDAFTVNNAWTAPVFYIGVNWVTKKGIVFQGDGSSTQNSLRQFGLADQAGG